MVPFVINEETALLICSLRPQIRSSVPAPPTSANVNIQTLARIERVRTRGNQHGQVGSLHETPQAATRAENDSQLERAPQATNPDVQTADGPDPAHASGQPRELTYCMRVLAHA